MRSRPLVLDLTALKMRSEAEAVSGLSPIPTPPMVSPEEMVFFAGQMETECLERLEPIDDMAALALHVAILTGIVARLTRSLEEL